MTGWVVFRVTHPRKVGDVKLLIKGQLLSADIPGARHTAATDAALPADAVCDNNGAVSGTCG